MTTPDALAVAVVAAHRGRLPFALLHRRPLVAHALAAAAELGSAVRGSVVLLVDDVAAAESEHLPAGTQVLTPEQWWSGLRAGPVLLHDPLCPLTPGATLAQLNERHRADPSRSLAGFRPVTDTVKTVASARIVGTVDRDRLAIVASPVLLSADLVAGSSTPPPLADFARLVAWARERGPVDLVKVPSMARRVQDEGSVHVLECVDEMAHQLRHPG